MSGAVKRLRRGGLTFSTDCRTLRPVFALIAGMRTANTARGRARTPYGWLGAGARGVGVWAAPDQRPRPPASPRSVPGPQPHGRCRLPGPAAATPARTTAAQIGANPAPAASRVATANASALTSWQPLSCLRMFVGDGTAGRPTAGVLLNSGLVGPYRWRAHQHQSV